MFKGTPAFIDLGHPPKNRAFIEWEADVPAGTDITLQTRTGDTVRQITRYYKKNGEVYPGTECGIRGEVLPSPVKEIGSKQAFTYLLRATFDADSRGFDEILIEAPQGSGVRVDAGDANGSADSEETVVVALQGGAVPGDVGVDHEFLTPNGDGINDQMTLSFSLMRVATSVPVRVRVSDLIANLAVHVAY